MGDFFLTFPYSLSVLKYTLHKPYFAIWLLGNLNHSISFRLQGFSRFLLKFKFGSILLLIVFSESGFCPVIKIFYRNKTEWFPFSEGSSIKFSGKRHKPGEIKNFSFHNEVTTQPHNALNGVLLHLISQNLILDISSPVIEWLPKKIQQFYCC